jgi:flagellar hook-associated protein 2
LNAVELAGDATMRYQGITVMRPTNTIDDLVAGITLTLHSTTDTSVPITIEQNAEAAKESIITFVGRYNQVLGELNVLTQNRDEIVRELAYLSQPEQDAARERLGMFMGDQTLGALRNSLMSIVTDHYSIRGNERITMLSSLGISTRADSSGGVASRNLRGYLEIDEKKLDSVLKENMAEVKNLFGFDSDGDLVIDSGVAFRLDQQIQPYIQRNGILASRSSMINSRIAGSETRIARLESHLADREAQLKAQYSSMEATLNSLESQSNAMNNFAQQGQGR